MGDKSKRYTAEEKVKILREHLENQVPVGELSEKYGIHPNAIYLWKKEFFEKATLIFSSGKGKKDKVSDNKANEKIEKLEAKLKAKDSLISEIVEDNIRLKKNLNGED